MPKTSAEKSDRFNMRIPAADKALIARAAAIAQKDMSQFILENAVAEAKSVIDEAEKVSLSQRDFAMVMELLENPPPPNARLKAILASLPDDP